MLKYKPFIQNYNILHYYCFYYVVDQITSTVDNIDFNGPLPNLRTVEYI